MNETKTLGQRLYECREKTGMKQADVARALNVQRQQISYYENDSRQPDLDRLKELSRLYGVSTDYLLGMTDVLSNDLEIKEVCNYTGLSENAVAVLHCNATYREKFGSAPEEKVFDTIEQTTEYPYVNNALLDALNALIEYGYETALFDALINFVNSDYMQITDMEGKDTNYLFFKNGKMNNDMQAIFFNREQLESLSLMIVQDELRNIKRECAPKFEGSPLWKRLQPVTMKSLLKNDKGE